MRRAGFRQRVFILGPSHHVYLDGCALTTATDYDTPLYPLPIDSRTVAELRSTKMFQDMSIQTDEDEHSLEMHLPYIAKVMESHKGAFAIVPILVGNLSSTREHEYGELFARYLADPTSLFVISSDFCHWGICSFAASCKNCLPYDVFLGKRFTFTHYNSAWGDIHESIERLDRLVRPAFLVMYDAAAALQLFA